MHVKGFQEPKHDAIWKRHQEDQHNTQSVKNKWSSKSYQKANQHMIDFKVQQMN